MTSMRRRINGHRKAPKLVRPIFPGVDTAAWTDLPPAQYPRPVVDLISKLLEAGDRLARINAYRCDGCQGITITRLTHPGIAPTVVDHARFDPATRCPGTATSLDYPVEAADHDPSHEFYRPSEDELLDLDDKLIDFVLRGGLLLRLIPLEAGR